MTDQDTKHRSRSHKPEDPGPGEGPHGDELAAQMDRLERLRAGEDELRKLRGRECQLEVEVIAEKTLGKSAPPNARPDFNSRNTTRLAETFERRELCQAAYDSLMEQAGRDTGRDSSELAQLNAGQAALDSWLAAPASARGTRLLPWIHKGVVIGVIGTLLASLAIHLVFLVLLLPLTLPLAYVAWSRQNVVWLRLGAERQFQATGLQPPKAWKTPEVSERLSQIRQSIDLVSKQMDELAMSEDQNENDAEFVVRATELAEAESNFRSALADAGLTVEGLDPELKRWLKQRVAAKRLSAELNDVRAKRAAVNREVANDREELFRYLSRQGAAPPDGRADLSTLEFGLQRLMDGPLGKEMQEPK